MTVTTDNLTDLARGLLNARRVELGAKPRSKAAAVTHAYFEGMCDAAYRLGIGMSPAHVFMTVVEVMALELDNPRPAYESYRNTAQKQFDAAQAAALAARLNEMM